MTSGRTIFFKFASENLSIFLCSTDFHDGLVLIRLLEALTNKKIVGCERNPRLTAHKMVNLDLVFHFIAEEKIKLIGIGE